MAKKIRVAVLGGGFSSEREISLMTAKQIMAALPGDRYEAEFIDVDKRGKWMDRRGDIIAGTDVAFIALHGRYGEDGRIQAVLDLWGVPYTGSGVLASALGMDKAKCMEFLAPAGIRIPAFVALRRGERSIEEIKNLVSERFGYPCVVKPNESGSSVATAIVRSEDRLEAAIKAAFEEDKTVLVMEYVKGRELTCGVMGDSGQTEAEALPPIEIIAHGSEFFDYQTKYFSKTVEEVCPAAISKELTEKIQRLSEKIHRSLGCEGLTRSDFILSEKDGELYFLEINTIPGQTEASLCPKEAKAIGLSFAEFIEKQIRMALEKK